MKPECREIELLLSLRATGDELPASDAAQLDRHLEGCSECRAELEQSRTLLDVVRLPPVSVAELRAMDELPSRALSALRRKDRRRGMARRVVAVVGGLALAAGLVLALLSPAVIRNQAPAGTGQPSAPVQVAWQEPDVDALWTESAVVEVASDLDDEAVAETVLAAYDDAGI